MLDLHIQLSACFDEPLCMANLGISIAKAEYSMGDDLLLILMTRQSFDQSAISCIHMLLLPF